MGTMIVLLFLFIEPYGAVGAAMAVSLANVVVMFFNVWQVNQILPGTATKTFTQSLPFFIAGGLMTLAVIFSQGLLVQVAGGENILSLSLLVLVGAAVYIAVILLLQRALILELYELFVRAMGIDKRWPRLLPNQARVDK